MSDVTASVRDTEDIRVWLETMLRNQEALMNQFMEHQSAILAEFDSTFGAPSWGHQHVRPVCGTEVAENNETQAIGTLEPTKSAGDDSALPKENVWSEASFPDGDCQGTPGIGCRTNADRVLQFMRYKVFTVSIIKSLEVVSIILILCNLALMACERQWYGMLTGYDIGFYNEPPHRFWFHHSHFVVINTCIFIFSVVELFFRTGAAITSGAKLRSYSVLWIFFDAILIFLEAVVLFARITGGHLLNVRPTLLRAFRLLGLARLILVFKDGAMFDSLFLLIRAIRASMGALCWSFLLLFLLQLIVGLIFSEGFDSYVRDSSDAPAKRLRLFQYFGTPSRALITMFEISLGNWVPTCRFLMEQVSEKYVVFYLVYRCMLCFAIVKVISAVFIAETNQMLAADEDIEVRKKYRARRRNKIRMARLFPLLTDQAGGEYITKDHLEMALKDDHMRTRLSALDIEVHDIDALFQVLDDIDKDNGDGTVMFADFIKGMSLIKGQARSLDVMYLRKQTNEIVETLAEITKRLNRSQQGSSLEKTVGQTDI